MHEYLSFVAFAALIAVAPGPDTLLTLRQSVVGGSANGLWTALGITAAGTIQGLLAAAGLGAIIARTEIVFEVIRWAGVLYLIYLAVQSVRSALRRDGGWDLTGSGARRPRRWRSLRAGFLCNITNPKVLAFNLAVLPQFVGSGGSVLTFAAYALTLTAIGAVVLLVVVAIAGRVRRALQSSRVRRGVDGGTAAVFAGFATALAAEA